MPPKAPAKKAAEKQKIAEDKTFGMKNKNKSKVVQKYIKQITASVHGAPKGGLEDQKRKEKDDKQKDMQKAALLNSLFNQGTDKKGRAFDPIAKKKAKQEAEEALAAGKKLDEKVRKDIIEGIANTIRLTNPKGVRMSEMGGHPIVHALKDKHAETFKILSLLLFIKANPLVFWVDDAESTNPCIRCQEDVDAEVAPDERPIEEIIEERRRALPPGGTPVTNESFKAWQAKREKERLEAEEAARTKKEQEAKKTGKTTGMSGKDLFSFDASLFVDDEGAVDANEYDERSEHAAEDDEPTKGVAADLAEADEGEEVEGDSGARGSGDAPKVAINEDLFLEGDDGVDDLDDLDDLDDE